MGYYEFIVTAPDVSKDSIANMLAEKGCLGINETGQHMLAYFKDSCDVSRLRDELNSFRELLKDSGLDPSFSFEYNYLAERDWNETWKEKFTPIDVGECLSIVPPWEKTDNGRIRLIIDPGMAFGTGHHETTRTCLTLIERFSTLVSKNNFLDIGTGTGILAIAASKLGFKRVTGVDTDPLAVDAARRNAELNSLLNIDIKEGGISDVEGTYDLIVANLVSGVLMQIASDIALRLESPGIAVLSGMLAGQEEEVLGEMERAGLALSEKIIDGRWVSLILTH